MGDSDSEFKDKILQFYQKLEKFKDGSANFTLIIDDPLDNSFLQNFYYPAEDQRVVIF
jgi:C4-type Zn-finger protein